MCRNKCIQFNFIERERAALTAAYSMYLIYKYLIGETEFKFFRIFSISRDDFSLNLEV